MISRGISNVRKGRGKFRGIVGITGNTGVLVGCGGLSDRVRDFEQKLIFCDEHGARAGVWNFDDRSGQKEKSTADKNLIESIRGFARG